MSCSMYIIPQYNVLCSLAENNVPKIMSIRKYTILCLLRAWFIGGRIIVAWKLMHSPHFIAPIFSAKYTLCVFTNGGNRISPFHFIMFSINRMLCLHKSFEDKSLVSPKFGNTVCRKKALMSKLKLHILTRIRRAMKENHFNC